MSTTLEAATWVKAVVRNYVPKNARNYKYSSYTLEKNVSSALGFQIDLKPMEGKVVDCSVDFVLIKTGRITFFVAEKGLLSTVPAIGSTVRVEPYARKRFDGQRLDTPTVEIRNGYTSTIHKLGESVSPLPLDKTSIKSPNLLGLIEHVETLPAGDGIRKLSQVFVDAGARSVSYTDPENDHESISYPPSLMFQVNTGKHGGTISIVLDIAADLYRVRTQDREGNLVNEVGDVYFDDLASVVVELIDDGQWRIAPVEVIKPKRKIKAA